MNSIQYLERVQGELEPLGIQPFIIAEAGVNHGGDIDLAFRLIEEASRGGADAIKFQTYKAETLASRNSPAYWDRSKEPTGSQYELFKKYDRFGQKDYERLKKYCDEVGIEFMSTPFDVESAEYLDELMRVFKISSSDLNNLPFIEKLCSFGKPILLSTGASTPEELDRSVGWIRNAGNPLVLMHCVLNYPTPIENANLMRIRSLQTKFPNLMIGYSDHVPADFQDVMLSAFLLGATVLEKHFTYDKSLQGNDHYHAMDMSDLIELRERLDVLIQTLGTGKLEYSENEVLARTNARRSLVASVDILEGSRIRKEWLTWKRPGTGVPPCDINEIVGKVVARDIAADDVLAYKDFL